MILTVYIEVDENSQPLYKEEFINCFRDGSEETSFWISEEYASLLDETDKQNRQKVCVISSELLKEIDCSIRSPKDRALSLEIQRNSGIEESLVAVLNQWNIKIVLLRGSYLSINWVCSQKGIDEFVHRDGIAGTEGSVEYLRTKVSQLEDEHRMLFEQKYTDEQTIKSLRECLTSTEQYLNELQLHASKLDKQLNEYHNIESKLSELEAIEHQKDTYIKLYKEKLSEVDELKKQLLDTGKYKK